MQDTARILGLSLNQGQSAFFGSMPMGIVWIRAPRDMDIVTTDAEFARLRELHQEDIVQINSTMMTIEKSGMHYDVVRRWLDWDKNMILQMIQSGNNIDGIVLAKLEFVLKYKNYLNREKDRQDIEYIERYMREWESVGKNKVAHVNDRVIYSFD
jgi:hypothetical protein